MNGVKYYWLTQTVAFIKRWPSYKVTTIVRFHHIPNAGMTTMSHRMTSLLRMSLKAANTPALTLSSRPGLKVVISCNNRRKKQSGGPSPERVVIMGKVLLERGRVNNS